MSRVIYDPERHCFRYWWACLPAIPPGRDALDWWARPDGRAAPYRRLKRVWNDATWFKRPASDRFRKHEFANPATGTHMMIQLWENWTLFHPSDWVPRLFGLLGMRVGIGPWDACWSYEFEDNDTSKLTDITLHCRNSSGHETLLVIEAKGVGDALKPAKKDRMPDADPNTYTNLAPYKCIDDRRMFYLVHEAKRMETNAQVSEYATARSNDWAVGSWEDLISLQAELAGSLLPEGVSTLVQTSILAQGRVPCIEWDRIEQKGFPARSRLPEAAELAELMDPGQTEDDRLRIYLRGCKLFWQIRSGAVDVDLPFGYLGSEPGFPELHDQIAIRKKAGMKNPAMKECLVPLWKLGPFEKPS